MLATAHLMGKLDARGVPCPVCRGDAVVGDHDCPYCEDPKRQHYDNGRLRPSPEQEEGEGFAYDALVMGRLVLQSRERSWAPMEWLEQPAEFMIACDTAALAINEIEERDSDG